MTELILNIKSVEEMALVSKKVLELLTYPTLILLNGSLGSGKTTFCKYFLPNFGISPDKVKSPTYSLINNFKTPSIEINHLDLYRLDQPDQILTEEIKQLVEIPQSITLIEWPDRLSLQIPPNSKLQQISINFTILENNSRQITIQNDNKQL